VDALNTTGVTGEVSSGLNPKRKNKLVVATKKTTEDFKFFINNFTGLTKWHEGLPVG